MARHRFFSCETFLASPRTVECEAYSTGVDAPRSTLSAFQKMLHRPLQTLPFEPVSHNPLAQKQVWFRKGELPPFTQIAHAVIDLPSKKCGGTL